MIPKNVDYKNLLISKNEMQNFLFNLDYLSFLKNKGSYVQESQVTGNATDAKAEVAKAQSLLDNLWIYLNPHWMEKIQFKALYDFMALMMAHATKMKEQDLTVKLVKSLIAYYKSLSINLNIPKISEEN